MKPFNTKKSLRYTLLSGYSSIFLVLGAMGGWATLAQLNGAVIAQATIVVESYSKKVQHQAGGIVSRILVKDGDRVTEGQDLVVLDFTDAKTELGITDGALDELLIKRARLEAQRDGVSVMVLNEEITKRRDEPTLAATIGGQNKLLKSAFDSIASRSSQLKEQISQLKEQIDGLGAQLNANKRQTELIEKELGGLKKLQAKGLVPNSRILSVERESASLEGQRGELLATKATTQSRIGEVELRILQLSEDSRTQALTDLRETEARITELQERRVALSSRLARTTIKAPITGLIYQLAVHTEGGVVGPGETLMLIVPEGDDLVLQAQVAPNDIDQISVGQIAQVRFPSFNSNLTPEIGAVVQQVSADTSRIDANSPPFYAVRLVITAAELKKLGSNKLKPGMSAEAFIQTTAQSPLSYMLKPLTDQVSRALRES